MKQARILIVEDEIIIARELEARLNIMGYEVPAIASSGVEAIRLAEETQPNLVLMDIVLKGDMDGIEAATEIRRRLQTPVVYLTAYTDEKTLQRAKITEPHGYIVKPFSERELRANIEMALYKHQSESRLRKVERWFADALEGLAEAVITTDCYNRVTDMNQAAECITAWKKEEAVGKELQDVFRLVERDTGTAISMMSASEGPLVCLAEDTFLIDKSESAVPVDSTTICVRNADELPMGTVSIFRETSGRRRDALTALVADVALAAAHSTSTDAMLQLCAESMVHNLDATLARVWTLNPARDVLVLRASAGLYTHLDGLYSRVPLSDPQIGLIARDRKPYMTNDVLTDSRTDDPEWARREGIVAFAGFPMIISDQLLGVVAVFFRRPIAKTVLDTIESTASTIAMGIQRNRLEEQLRTSQKMEAVGLLAGGIAHDFNNLLTVINGCSDILREDNNLTDESKGILREMEMATQRAALLTRQLLVFSRRQILNPKTIDLNVLISNLGNMLRRIIGEDIVLSTILTPGLSNVTSDPGQLEQVIMNLAVNARDAMPDGGKLTIETRNISFDDSFARMRPEIAPGDFVLLSVSDTGTGITPEHLPRIFEPFFTTKENHKGTGLGLSTVYGIVEQSGGHIDVYSELGFGTTFKVYLPSTKKGLDADHLETLSKGLLPGYETILLVEDEEIVRQFTLRVLKKCGYTVLEAPNGAEALRVAEKYAGRIHLLITDVIMPEMAGRVLSEQLSALRPDIDILFISGYAEDAITRHGVLDPQAAFLSKPFTSSALSIKVREVLDKPVSPQEPVS